MSPLSSVTKIVVMTGNKANKTIFDAATLYRLVLTNSSKTLLWSEKCFMLYKLTSKGLPQYWQV